MEEVIVVKNRRVNNPSILSSGAEDFTLIGSSDESCTEQRLTSLPIGIRSPRGSIRVLLTLEYKFGELLSGGVGLVTLYHVMSGKTGFHISAVHNLPAGVTRLVRIHWFAFGYEDFAASDINLTSPPELGETKYAKKEKFTGITNSITLSRVPVLDPTLIIYADRIAMFMDDDFSVSGSTLLINEPLTGVEAVTVIYTSKEV
jgi:hypothetical protein